jgi:integrase
MEQRKETTFKGYIFINPETGDYYRTSRRIMERLCAAVGVAKFGFHSVRHLSSSMMVAAGVNLIDIQCVLRHIKQQPPKYLT